MPAIIIISDEKQEIQTAIETLHPYLEGRRNLEWRGTVDFPLAHAYWQELDEANIVAVGFGDPIKAHILQRVAAAACATTPLVIWAGKGVETLPERGFCEPHAEFFIDDGTGCPTVRFFDAASMRVAALSFEVYEPEEKEQEYGMWWEYEAGRADEPEDLPLRWLCSKAQEELPQFKAVAAVADVRDPYPYLNNP
jgi:hypothetical protein